MTDVSPTDDDDFLDFLPEFRGSKIVYLTAILLIPPLTQTVWLFYLKLRHPIILNGKEGCFLKISNAVRRYLCCVKVLEKRAKDYKKGDTWEAKKQRYEELCTMLHKRFAGQKPKKLKYWKNIEDWLLTLKEINTTQSSTDGENHVEIDLTTFSILDMKEEDIENEVRTKFEQETGGQAMTGNEIIIVKKKMKDGRIARMRQCKDEFRAILDNVVKKYSFTALDEETPLMNSKGDDKDNQNSEDEPEPYPSDLPEQTEMMIIINHHIRIMNTVERMKQLNYGINISDRTDPRRKGSMEWKSLIQAILKLEPGLTFPDALRYASIRALSDDIFKKWDKTEMGHEFDPHALILLPWTSLQTNAFGFIDSFLMDVWIYWVQVWFGTVVLGILFG